LKYIFILVLSITFISCGNKEKKQYLESCQNITTKLDLSYSTRVTNLKPIEIKPTHHKQQPHYSILEKENNWLIIETAQRSQTFTIYDVKNSNIVKHGSLDSPPIFIGATTFKSLDSLYFQLPVRSRIIRFDSAGILREKIDLGSQRTDWSFNDSKFGLFNNHRQGALHFTNNNIFFVLNAFDFWEYPDKTAIKTLGEFNPRTNKLVRNFGEQSNYLTNNKVSLPDKYTYPHLSIAKNRLYVSFPFDHNIYKYDINDKSKTEENCVSSQFISKLPDPLSKSFSQQESINFQLSTPYYGQVNYHKEMNIFTRLVFHSTELYTPDGKLNYNHCSRSYSLIVFDTELNVINEIFLGTGGLWEYALAISSGYIVPGKCENYLSEDIFRYTQYYELFKN